MLPHPVVAIDGPAGSGKSTVARRVARELGFTLLDTGAIYRTLALLAEERGVGWSDGPRLAGLALGLPVGFRLQGEVNRVYLVDRDVSEAIRTPRISGGASTVSAIAEVRQALLALQRRFADEGPLVAEGRDMGTVVFPGAAVKVFLEASAEERARRRHLELRQLGHDVPLERVLAEQRERDEADSTRAVAPLRPAADAVILDTTHLPLDEVVERILSLAREVPTHA